MQDRAMCLVKVSPARNTRELTPGWATGMAIGADSAAPEPAVIGAIRIGTEMRLGIDRALAAPGEADDRRW